MRKRSLLFLATLAASATSSGGREAEESRALFPVVVNGKYGYMDRTGRIVISPQFRGTWGFSEGLAAVNVGGKYGYIDEKGKIVIEPRFDWALGFSKGLAKVMIGRKAGYIDKTGRYVWEPAK